MINFVILIASAGSAGAITFQATLNQTSEHIGMDVVSIIGLNMPEKCFEKQTDGHNCFAGAAQIMATMCGKQVQQDSCDREGKPPFKGSITECLVKIGFTEAHDGNRQTGTFQKIWNELENFNRPVGMGVEKVWTTKKGKRKAAGHAMAILAAAGAKEHGEWVEVSNGNGKRLAQFLGVIDPWGRTGVQSYDLASTIDPGFKTKIPRMGLHWIPYEKLGGETLSSAFATPAGWDDAKISRFVFMGTVCGGFDVKLCPKGVPGRLPRTPEAPDPEANLDGDDED